MQGFLLGKKKEICQKMAIAFSVTKVVLYLKSVIANKEWDVLKMKKRLRLGMLLDILQVHKIILVIELRKRKSNSNNNNFI